MILKIDKKLFKTIIFYCFFVMIEIFLLKERENFKLLTFFIIINFLIQSVIFFYLKNSIVSFGAMYILLSQPFQFGVIILHSFSYEFSGYMKYSLTFVNESSLYRAGVLSLYFFNSLMIGYIINIKRKTEYKRIADGISYFRMGLCLCIPFGILWIVLQAYNFMLTQSGYYTNIYNVVPSTFITLSLYVYVGLFFLMIHYKKQSDLVRVNVIFMCALVLTLVSTLNGVRSMGMCIFVLLIVLYNLCIRKIDKNILVWGLAIIVFILPLMTAIMHIRKSGVSFINLMKEWWICINSNIIFNVLEEFGLTSLVLAREITMSDNGAITFQPLVVFFHELVISIPGLSNIFPEYVSDSFNIIGLSNMGTSCIADLYYYMGRGCIFFAFIWGMIISHINNNFEKFIRSGDYYNIGIRWIFYIQIFSGIRSAFRLGYKALILSTIVLFIIRKLMGNKGGYNR